MTNRYAVQFFRKPNNYEAAQRLFRFRKRLFIDRCGWDLPHDGCCEVDEFDTAHTVYCALSLNEQLIGTFRAIRADRPYLAKYKFAELAVDQPYPASPHYWEISRFGVLPDTDANIAAHMNYAAMFLFAKYMQAHALIALADLTYERFLRLNRIVTVRYGPPQHIGFDRDGNDLIAVAGEIPMSAQQRRTLDRFASYAQHMEVYDVDQILRPARISA